MAFGTNNQPPSDTDHHFDKNVPTFLSKNIQTEYLVS